MSRRETPASGRAGQVRRRTGRELGFAPLWRAIFKSHDWRGTSPATKLVMIALIARVRHRSSELGAAGTCEVRLDEIAADLELTTRSVSDGLRELEMRGWITRRRLRAGYLVEIVNYDRWKLLALVDAAMDPYRESEGEDRFETGKKAQVSAFENENEIGNTFRSAATAEGEIGDTFRSGSEENSGPSSKQEDQEEDLRKKKPITEGREYQRALTHFDTRFFAAYAAKPTWSGKNCKLLRELVRAHGADQVIARTDRMFDQPLDWPPGPYDVGYLSQRFDQLVAVGRASSSRRGLTPQEIFDQAAEEDRRHGR